MYNKLGKLKPKVDRRTLQFQNYLDEASLPPVPHAFKWSTAVKQPWGMMRNDAVGCCTIATAGHEVMCWTGNALGTPKVIPDDQIIAAYSAVTGYNPNDPGTDRGAVVLDVLNYWRRVGIGGTKILAYAQVNPKRADHVRAAAYLFGGVYLGVALPASAQAQTDQGVWSVPATGLAGNGAPGSWGGHAIPVVDVDDKFLTVLTWGQLLKMSWNFFYAYVDECYAVASHDWVKRTGVSPSGFKLAALLADLSYVAN